MEGSQVGSGENLYRIGATKIEDRYLLDAMLRSCQIDNEESVSHANDKADRSTLWIHRTDENNEEKAVIYYEDERVQKTEE